MSTSSTSALNRIRRSLDELPELVKSLPRDHFEVPPGSNEWSAQQVLVHLADSEQVYGVRVRMILAAERPRLTPYDQEVWAERFTDVEPPEQALARWSALRKSIVLLLESLGDDQWHRIGLHEERGPESIEVITQRMAQHDEDHMAQMREATRPSAGPA